MLKTTKIKGLALMMLLAIVFGSVATPFSVSRSGIQKQEAHAQWVVEDVLGFPTHLLNFLKDYVLNTLVNMFIKTLAHQVTVSIINWINSGFSGSPSFVQDPGSFFQNLGDNIAGDFIGAPGSPLAFLCSPISLDVRLSLALNTAGIGGNNYSCTLSKAVGSVKGATINGFTAGDFAQGGWTSFATLSEAQNSTYGAFLQAQSSISVKANNRTTTQKEQLNQGQGFLSFPVCKDDPSINPDDFEVGDDYETKLSDGSVKYNKKTKAYQSCTTQTPGSFLENQLNFAAESPLRQLDIADNINAIVSSLMVYMVNQILSVGLGAISGSHSGDKNSYLAQILQQQDQQNNALSGSLGSNLSSSVGTSVGYAQQVKSYADSSLAMAQAAKASFQSALSYCTSVSDGAVASQISSEMSLQVDPLIATLQAQDANATNQYNQIVNLQNQSANATSSSSLQGALAGTTAGGSSTGSPLGTTLQISEQNVNDAQIANGKIKTQTDLLTKDAKSYEQQCVAYAAQTTAAH